MSPVIEYPTLMAGRDIKTNALYFTHDAGMRDDPRIKALRRQFGHEGYAVWNYLLEVLTDAHRFEIPWLDLDIELIAGDFDVDPDKLRQIVGYCEKIQLLSVVDGKLFSQKHKDRFDKMMSKRTQERERIASRRASNTVESVPQQNTPTPNSAHCCANNTEEYELLAQQFDRVEYSRVEESRVDESREEKNISKKESVSVSASDGAAAAERETFFRILECFYFRALPDPWREVDRFLDHYKGVGWVNKNGVPIKDKLAVARNWEPQNKPARPPMPKDVLAWLRTIYERTKITNPNQADALLRVFDVAKNDSEKQLHLSVWVVKDRVVEKEFWRKMIPVIFRAMQEKDPLRDYVISIKQKKR